MRKIFSLAFVIILLVSCSETPSDSKNASLKDLVTDTAGKYKFPLFSISVPDNTYTFSDSEDQTLVTVKNSRIYVSKNSFEDKKGKDIEGKVDLIFKEYHTQGEIIASKLPMVYTTPTGEKQDFESAGMFEIRAFQEGKELNLKKGKSIRVDLVSTNNGTFNFYNFNEKDVAWKLKDTECVPVHNPVKKKLVLEKDSLNNLPKQQPKKPIELKEGDPVFDINIDYEEYPNLEDLNGVMWKITDANDSLNKLINSRLFKRIYSFVRLEPLGNEDLEFKLFFIQGYDTLAFNAAPVMKGKLLSKQKEKYKDLIASIHEKVKRENEIKDQLKKEKDLLRSFNVDQLGIYNYDRQFKDPYAFRVLAHFIFEGSDPSLDLSDVSVYLIPSSKKAVIQYTKETFENFAINPKENNKIIAVLPSNEVYYLSNKDIHALKLENHKDQKAEIRLKKYKKDVQEALELDELMAKL